MMCIEFDFSVLYFYYNYSLSFCVSSKMIMDYGSVVVSSLWALCSDSHMVLVNYVGEDYGI